MDIEALKYPIGKPKIPAKIEPDAYSSLDLTSNSFLCLLTKEVTQLTDNELRYKYRPRVGPFNKWLDIVSIAT